MSTYCPEGDAVDTAPCPGVASIESVGDQVSVDALSLPIAPLTPALPADVQAGDTVGLFVLACLPLAGVANVQPRYAWSEAGRVFVGDDGTDAMLALYTTTVDARLDVVPPIVENLGSPAVTAW